LEFIHTDDGNIHLNTKVEGEIREVLVKEVHNAEDNISQ